MQLSTPKSSNPKLVQSIAFRLIFAVLAVFAVCAILSSCAHITAEIPLATGPDAPIAKVDSWKCGMSGDLTAQLPNGLNLTYASKIDPQMALTTMWMSSTMAKLNDTIDRLNAIANSPAGQAALKSQLPAQAPQLTP